jgi:hypothetical protein
VIDLNDFTIDYFKAGAENDRLILFLDDSNESDLTCNWVCGDNLKFCWAGRGSLPEPSANRNFLS